MNAEMDRFLLIVFAVLLSSCSSSVASEDKVKNDLKGMFERDMVFVEGGTFMMGQIADEDITRALADSIDDDSPRVDELPVHQVTVSDFYISKFEVTQQQWIAVMGNNPSYFGQGGNYPIDNVSWDDVQLFLTELNRLTGENYRLPTEAEWEYAARGGKYSRGFRYSGSDSVDEVAWYTEDNLEQMNCVGLKKANELGLYDMSGNAFEWCFDWFAPYSNQSQTNPKGVAMGEHHILRGGSWKHSSNGCRVSFRSRIETKHLNKCGFRIVKGIDLSDVPYTENNVGLTDIFTAETGLFNGVELCYRKAVVGAAPMALVIYLHGGSQRGNDNSAQLSESGVEKIYKYLVSNNISAAMLVPQCPSSASWGKSMNRVLKGLIDAHISDIDTKRIYGFGGSMGGTGLWSLVSTYSGMFTAAMPVAANPSSATVESVLPTHIYTVIGEADTIGKIDVVEEFVSLMKEAGGSVVFDIEAGWDHATTCEQSYTDARLEWIFSKIK